jgi:hypothetical protein
MSQTSPTAERREEILGELAEWMHAAAREAQRRLLAAETTDEFVKLSASLVKLGRGVRQSTLIHRKLEAERLEADRRAEDSAASAEAASGFVPRHIKRVRLRTAVTRHVWNRLEGVDAELFHDDLNARLDELEGEDDFLDTPIDDLIDRLCRDLGFEPPAAPATATPQANAQTRSQAPSGAAPAQRVGEAVLAPDSS